MKTVGGEFISSSVWFEVVRVLLSRRHISLFLEDFLGNVLVIDHASQRERVLSKSSESEES